MTTSSQIETSTPERRYQDIIIKDFSNQPYFDDDGQDFIVRTITDERLIDSLPEGDDDQSFAADMYNIGDEEDLPDSDRETQCRGEGIPRSKCLNR